MFYKQIQQSQNYKYIYGNLKYLFPLMHGSIRGVFSRFPAKLKDVYFNISQWSFEVEILFENVKNRLSNMSNFRKRLPPKARSGARTTTGEDKSKYVYLNHSGVDVGVYLLYTSW